VNLKMMMLASFAAAPLVSMAAMAQTETPTKAPTDLNSPAAHKTTTVREPDGRIEHTPPVGLRSGGKNVGGE
jgi:hypothetical protein